MKKEILILIILLTIINLFGCIDTQPNLINQEYGSKNLLSILPKTNSNLKYYEETFEAGSNLDEIMLEMYNNSNYYYSTNCTFKNSAIKAYTQIDKNLTIIIFVGEAENKQISQNCLNNFLSENFALNQTYQNSPHYFEWKNIFDNNILINVYNECSKNCIIDNATLKYINEPSFTEKINKIHYISGNKIIYLNLMFNTNYLKKEDIQSVTLFKELLKIFPQN